jgi:hypothetical protein
MMMSRFAQVDTASRLNMFNMTQRCLEIKRKEYDFEWQAKT